MSYSTTSLDAFLAALARPEPTPGGGTASAVSGAMGTALLVMVSGLSRTRGVAENEPATLAAIKASLEPLGRQLMEAADRDARAFEHVMAAYKLPKSGDAEKAARSAAIQGALREATEVPLEALRLATQALELGEAVARHGNASAASDVRVAAGLLGAAAEGAAANVRINLDGLKDEEFGTNARLEVQQLTDRAVQARGRLEAALA